MQRGKEYRRNPSANISPTDIDRQTISGCYGIDSLFAKKDHRLSFAEFCSGLKNIFLAIPILGYKFIAALFDIVKRPICAFGLMCIAASAIIANIFGGKLTVNNPAAKCATTVQNVPIIGVQKPRIFSDIDEHIPTDSTNQKENPPNAVANTNHPKDIRTFEDKLYEFFAEHAISDVACVNGSCRLKLNDGIFTEHSILCNNPKIVLESSTDDEIVFSDGAGTFCALAIESLLH
jgi:hypothetical protein